MDNCVFCRVIQGKVKSWKVYEDEHTYAFLDINPANEYHTLVIPKNHYENIFDVPETDLLNVMRTIKKVVNMYEKKLGIKNVQIINSSGVEAQQDIFHLHFHIVPRSLGDNQNINWITHKELREKFDDLFNALKD